jgi:hypothetical protein
MAFALLAVLAYRSVGEALRSANWLLVVIAASTGTLISQFLNSLEFREIGRASGTEFTVVESVRISLIGSAANLLPVPGSVAVRLHAIKASGSSLGRGAAASVGVGGYFVSVTLLIAGLVTALTRGGWPAVVATVIGAAGSVISATVLIKAGCSDAAIHFRVVVIEAALIAVGGIRITLVLVGLVFDVDLSQGVGLTVAGALTTAVGFFPAGLGLRELLVAGISPIVGIAASAGLTGAIVDRFFRMVLLAAVAIWLSIRPGAEADARVGDPSR